eukprot:Sdes_comp20518_c0_seq1m15089
MWCQRVSFLRQNFFFISHDLSKYSSLFGICFETFRIFQKFRLSRKSFKIRENCLRTVNYFILELGVSLDLLLVQELFDCVFDLVLRLLASSGRKTDSCKHMNPFQSDRNFRIHNNNNNNKNRTGVIHRGFSDFAFSSIRYAFFYLWRTLKSYFCSHCLLPRRKFSVEAPTSHRRGKVWCQKMVALENSSHKPFGWLVWLQNQFHESYQLLQV